MNQMQSDQEEEFDFGLSFFYQNLQSKFPQMKNTGSSNLRIICSKFQLLIKVDQCQMKIASLRVNKFLELRQLKENRLNLQSKTNCFWLGIFIHLILAFKHFLKLIQILIGNSGLMKQNNHQLFLNNRIYYQKIEPDGGTDIVNAIKALNKEIKSISEYIKERSKIEQNLQKPNKFWIFFLSDNEDEYQQNDVKEDSKKRDEYLQSQDLKRFIRIWDQKVAEKEKLKEALGFNEQTDAQYDDPFEEVRNTIKILKLNTLTAVNSKKIQKIQQASQDALKQTEETIKQNEMKKDELKKENEQDQKLVETQENKLDQMIDQSSIATSQLNLQNVIQKYIKLKENCEETAKVLTGEEKRTNEAYNAIDDNDENYNEIENYECIQIQLIHKAKKQIENVKKWSEQDKKLVEETINQLENQLKLLEEEKKKNKTNNSRIEEELKINTRNIFLQTLENIFKMFDKFLVYCTKYKDILKKFNSKVNRSKILLTQQIQGYTEMASVYKLKLQESQNLFVKLISYLKHQKKCFKEMNQDILAKLTEFQGTYKQLQSKIINLQNEDAINNSKQIFGNDLSPLVKQIDDLQMELKIIFSEYSQQVKNQI